jgi:hypothetical protein
LEDFHFGKPCTSIFIERQAPVCVTVSIPIPLTSAASAFQSMRLIELTFGHTKRWSGA